MTYLGKNDPLFDAVKKMVMETGNPSIARIQRKFLIGYSRVAAMISALADEGICIQNEREMPATPPSDSRTGSVESHHPPVIKVMGVGGCGLNAINYMVEKGIPGVEFIAISPDTNELARSKADQTLYLPCMQEMSPAKLTVTISDKDRRNINALITGADILFVVAGMGGSTGTSIAPRVAKIARALGILTVSVVSTPFSHEGIRPHRANQGIQELAEHTDALIIVPNAMLLTGVDQRVSDVFAAANDLMHIAVSGIAECVSGESLIGLDIADLRMILSASGTATMGTARASGIHRAKVACERAMSSIFPSSMDLANAHTILLNITASNSLKLGEIAEIMECVPSVAMDAAVVAAAIFDDSMGETLQVTLFATGLPLPFESTTNG